jgi:LytS/YehU family sensor histidine kinase
MRLYNLNQKLTQTISLLLTAQDENQRLSKKVKKLSVEIKTLQEDLHVQKVDNLRFLINPHTFRNSLNTITSFAVSTQMSLESLSGIFDYMLYDAQEQFVKLNQEVQFINQYLKLFKNRLSPEFNIQEDFKIECSPLALEILSIAPMITASFIENAFKHGDLKSRDAFIYIQLEFVKEKVLSYMVKNKVAEHKSETKGGLGRKKLEQRLELLYKGKHKLDYIQNGDVFEARLILELSNYEQTTVYNS